MSGATKWVGSIAALLIGTPAWSESKPAKKPKAVQEATEPAVETRNEGPKKEEPRRLFPNWPTPAFGLSVRPLIGFQSATTRKGDGSVTKASTLEAGLAGAVHGIPVMPGNPGFYLAPELGFAVGNVKADIRATNGVKTTDNSKYQRIWGDVDLIGYFHFYRHTLGLGRGEKQYSGDSDLRIRSTTIRNDLAILALDWFSTHLTHTFVRAYYTSFSDPFIQESDLWLHGNMFFDFLSFHLDSGPGSTIVDEYIDDAAGHRIGHAAGRSDYLRADMALRIIWKLGVSGSAKYVYYSSANDLGAFAGLRLPNEDLQEISRAPVPEDTLASTVFVGLHDLFGGLGIGWRENRIVYNLNENGDKKRETSSERSFGVSYQTRL